MNVSDTREFDELVEGLSVRCDGTVDDEPGCDNKVEYYVMYHGCNAEILCEDHTVEFVAHAMFALGKYGNVICTGCEQEFHYLPDFVRVRRV